MAQSDTTATSPARSFRTVLLLCLASTACSYESNGVQLSDDASRAIETVAAQVPAMCTTIAPRPEPQLPHGSVQGAAATTIKQWVEKILAAQTPPIAPGRSYAFQRLACRNLDTPFSSGRGCSFEVQIDGAEALKVSVEDPAPFASDLYEALDAADIEACNDPHGTFFELIDTTLTEDSLAYTNTSNYEGYPAPNLTVYGNDAKNILAAFAAAGLNDCDPIHKVFLLCGIQAGAAQCDYLRLALDQVGTAILLSTCGPSGGTTRGGDLTPEASRAVWNAISLAAKNAAFSDGPIEGATLLNANWFSWDGRELGMRLILSDAVPPTLAGPPPP